jgi:hypothetical protein
MLDVSDYANILSGDANQLVGAKNKTTFLDADTIREEGNDLDVRFGGIDAPETYKEWQGLSASQEVGAVQTAEQVQSLANQLGYTEVRRRFNPDGTPEMDATGSRQMGDLVHPETGKSFSRELAINGVVDIASGFDPGNILRSSRTYQDFLKGPRADQTSAEYQPNEFDKARMMIQEGVDEERRFAQQFKRAQKFSGEIGMLDEQIKMVEDGLSEMRKSGEQPTDQDLVGLQMLKKQRAAINESAKPDIDYFDRDDVTGRANNPMTVAWETGWNSVAQSAYALADMLGEKIDWEAAENFGEAGMERARTRMGENGKIITDYKDVDGFLTAVEFLGTNAAMSLPYMAASGGAALLAPVTGGLSYLAPVSLYTGNTWSEMEGDNKSATVAIGAGVLQAALDKIGINLIFKQGITPKAMYKDALTALTSRGMDLGDAQRLLLTATRKELAGFAGDAAKVARQQITGKAIFKDLATRGLIGGTGEGATEAMQEATAYLGATLGSDKVFDYNELTDRMIAASIAGTSLGTAFAVPGAAVNAGAWADVAVRQLPAEAKRLSEEGAQAEAERKANGEIAYQEAKAAETQRQLDAGQTVNMIQVEEFAEQARIAGSRVKSIEEKQQERNKELAERKEADSNYKPVDLDDRTEAHRKTKSERTLGETIGEMFASAPALWRRSIDYIIPAEVKRVSASARELAAQFGGGLQKVFSGADFEMAKRNRVSIYRNMLQNPDDFWNVMGNGKVLSQKEIDTLSDDIYKRLQAAVDSDGNYDSNLLNTAGLNPQQAAAIDTLAKQMNMTADAMYNDQIAAGGDLGQRKNYLHRYKTLNKVAVQKNRNAFEALLVQTYPQISPGDAKVLVDEILNSDTITDIDEAGAVAGIEFVKGFDVTKGGIVPGSHRSNTLGMSDKMDADGNLVFKDFMEQDIYKNIQHSIKSAARFTAHRDYIGKNGEKIAFLLDKMQAEGVPAAEVNRIAKLMKDYLNAESGNYKRPTSDMGKMLIGIQKNLMFLTTIGTLGMAAVSSLPELALSSRALTAEQIFKRKGSSSNDTSLQNFGKELASALGAAVKQTGSVITRREQALGNIDPTTGVPFASRSRGQALRRELGYDAWELGAATVTGVSEMNPSHQRFYEIFFKATGLTGFTNMTRSMRAAISADYIFDHVNIVVDQRTSGEVKTNEVQQSEEALRNIGINVDDMVTLFIESRKRDATGIDNRTNQEIEADDKLMNDNIRIGSMNFIDDAIALPGVANRPLIYQDPRFFLFTQFQGFIATFTANHIPKLWGEYVKRGTPAMKYNAFAIMATMIMMGFASQYLKDLIKYGGLDEDEYKTGKNPHLETEEYIQRGIRSSGLLGVGERVLDQFFPIYEQRSGNAGEWLWNTTTGEAPATGTLKRIGRAVGKVATGDFAGGAQEGSRLIPAVGVTGGFSRIGDFAPDSWNFKGE